MCVCDDVCVYVMMCVCDVCVYVLWCPFGKISVRKYYFDEQEVMYVYVCMYVCICVCVCGCVCVCRGFYKGLTPHVAKVTPCASLMFLGYETFVRIFSKFWSAHTDSED